MADINLKFKAHALGKSLEGLADTVQRELDQAIADTANAAYATIVAKAQEDLHSTRKDYLHGLSFTPMGKNTYLISLEGDFANAIEHGWTAKDVKSGMLASEKVVGVGARSGQKWVQEAEDGHKFAHVPFEHRPFSKAPEVADLAAAIRKIEVTNKNGRKQKLTQIFKDGAKKPLQGRVASVKEVDGFPNLAGLTKYQRVYKNETTGKETVQSVYMTFRTVSETGKTWNHPGFAGLKAFDEAEKWIEQEFENIINSLVK